MKKYVIRRLLLLIPILSWGWISHFWRSISAGWEDFLQEIWAPAIFPAAMYFLSLCPSCRQPCF